jgi:hypothetical protein
LKLATALAKYLYLHKNLNLPGVGTFTIDQSIVVPEVTDKTFLDFTRQIKFTRKNITAPDDALIEFIREQTKKIKPLAVSDLESYLEDGRILLNIGKPFELEGIGTILKLRDGTLEFTAGDAAYSRIESLYTSEKEEGPKKSLSRDEVGTPAQPGSRKALIGLSIIAGLVLVVWGGYSLYDRSAQSASMTIVENASIDTATVSTDTASLIAQPQLAAHTVADANLPQDYKFIIEKTANKKRAIRRYNQLRSYYIDVQMETPDSTIYKLYFKLPALTSDTIRIKDSLQRMYAAKRIFIER